MIDIKHVIKRSVYNFGYEIRSLKHTEGLRTTMTQSYSLLKELGVQPNTVIDVGVAWGTPDLYLAFPHSYFLLVEPLEEYEQVMISYLGQYRGSYVLAAAGSKATQVSINVHEDQRSGSSIYKETVGPEADGCVRMVPMIRVDDVLKEKNLDGPYLIKVDVQGAEVEVLKGCPQALQKAEVVVLEVSMFEFGKGAPQFYDVITFMKDHGFVAYDIILAVNRPLDSALGQIDMVFVKEYGRFRGDHSWRGRGDISEGEKQGQSERPQIANNAQRYAQISRINPSKTIQYFDRTCG